MNSKFVLCRPLGGLNDTLCQIERCWTYSRTFNRALIVDLSGNPLMRQFFSFLDFDSTPVPTILDPSPEDLSALIKGKTVFPREIRGRLLTYKVSEVISTGQNARTDAISGEPLSFDFSSDFEEDILLHHSDGGGWGSHEILSRIKIRQGFRRELEEALSWLPAEYACAHIRNTDYTTNFKKFFKHVLRRTTDRCLLILTDSQSVINYASERSGGKILINFGDLKVTGDEPLHLFPREAPEAEVRYAARRLLLEVIACARARQYFFASLSEENGGRLAVSGLSTLLRFAFENSLDFGLTHGGLPRTTTFAMDPNSRLVDLRPFRFRLLNRLPKSRFRRWLWKKVA